MRTMNSVLSSAAAAPARAQALKAIQARNSRKVIWILTSVPPKRPMVIDQGMVPPPFVAARHSSANAARAPYRSGKPGNRERTGREKVRPCGRFHREKAFVYNDLSERRWRAPTGA